jgi:hypothetical protein
MRYSDFAITLVEDVETQMISIGQVEQALRKMGYEDIVPKNRTIRVMVQIPEGSTQSAFRKQIQNEIFVNMRKMFPKEKISIDNDPKYGTNGAIILANARVTILIKDLGKQGDNSAGVANEIELASLLSSVIQKYGSANITFVDERGKKMSIKNATNVSVAGRDTADRKKADVVLSSKTKNLPISIKKMNAEAWESADTMFGAKAKEIILKLRKKGVLDLIKIGERSTKQGPIPVYKLSKEVVIEPTPEESMKVIFGSDLNPEGGIVIQTFKPEHYSQKDNNVTVQCHAVITNKEDIPESHLMVWLLRNDSGRNSSTLGIAGIKPMGVTLTRGIGKKGTKDVILVDQYGNVVKNPNI